MKPTTNSCAGVSPYTPQSVDVAITHLERVLCTEGADSLFAQAYWRGRLLQAFATKGLMRGQRERLQRLLDQLESAPKEFNSRTQLAENAPSMKCI
jgi:transcriptional regulator GlxA family with amidase domain